MNILERWVFGIALVALIGAAVWYLASIPESEEPVVVQMPRVAIDELALLVGASAETATVTVDPVEWLTGEGAVRAVAQDTECEIENAEDCMPSLANNFYIRNEYREEITYTVSPGAQVYLQDNAQETPATLEELVSRRSEYAMPFPVRIDRRGSVVLRIAEVYLP